MRRTPLLFLLTLFGCSTSEEPTGKTATDSAGCGRMWYPDHDGDSFGDGADAMPLSCEGAVGYVQNGEDCDDENPSVNPGSTEICNELDDDCNGVIDDEAVDAPTWHRDLDGDGYGDAATAAVACTAPDGFVGDASDCDDAALSVNPAAIERCDGVDEDCDGMVDDDAIDASTWYHDGDADSFGEATDTAAACTAPEDYVADGTDCDDAEAKKQPGGEEICDRLDNDCDGDTDEGVTTTAYADNDADGFGDAATPIEDCGVPAGYVEDDTDCDDLDRLTYPDAAERCDGRDNNCDGDVDEDPVDPSTWYRDLDGDLFGDADVTATACAAPVGYVVEDTDCDDTNSAVSPSEAEICNEIDDDCDGSTDEDLSLQSYYADNDGDGHGGAFALDSCAVLRLPTTSDDCDDTDSAVNPSEVEICNGIDDDCDGDVDGNAVDILTWYADADGDGYGDPSVTIAACDAPAGYVANGDDCDDTDPTSVSVWYYDADGDGDGDPTSATATCDWPGPGWTPSDGDCDDTDAAIHPGANEYCDTVDSDCDGSLSDGLDGDRWYLDDDADGYGGGTEVLACEQPGYDYVMDARDCDDVDPTIHPGARDVVGDGDRDCDGAGTCTGEDIYTGNVVYTGASFCSAYAGSVAIHGSLTVDSTAATTLSDLACVCTVQDDLIIEDNTSLRDLDGLDMLKSVGDALILSHDPLLGDLSDLLSLGSIGGDFTVSHNDRLTAMEGPVNLTSIGGNVLIDANDALASLSGLSALTTVFGYLAVRGLPALTDLVGLDGLETTYGLYIWSNSALMSLDGLSSLSTLNSDSSYSLYIRNNESLVDASALAPTAVSGEMYFAENPRLTRLPDFSALTETDSISVFSCDSLADLTGLANLGRVTGDFKLESNDSLDDLRALSLLTTVEGRLLVSDNQRLFDLDGVQGIREVGTLQIAGNQNLFDVDALAGLTVVSADLTVSSNSNLRSLPAWSGVTTVPGNLTIYDNDLLTNVDGLGALDSIGGYMWIAYNDGLRHLDGLGAIATIGGNVHLNYNDQLADVSAIETACVDGDLYLTRSSATMLPTDSDSVALCSALQLCNPALVCFISPTPVP